MQSSFSQFQKDYSPTREHNTLASSSFDLVQSFDQMDLQQTCLIRLKKQRQRIQQLTKLYQQSQKDLFQKNQQQGQLQQQIEELTEMASYKPQCQQLNRQHQSLLKKYQMAHNQLNALKKQLQGLSTSTKDQAMQLRKDIKYLKEQKLLSDANWSALLTDKEDEIKKQARIAQEKQYEHSQQIQILKDKIECLEEVLAEQKKELQSNKEQFWKELSTRDQDLANFEKIIQSFKKQNGDYRSKIINMQDQFDTQKHQLMQALDQYKAHLKMLKNDNAQKDNEIYQCKQTIKKYQMKNQALELTVASLKASLKKLKANNDSSFKKITSTSEDQKCKLQLFVSELKNEVERQMEENSMLAGQLKRIKGYIQRKEQQQKQRKLLLMSEFREIDKVDRMVSKLI